MGRAIFFPQCRADRLREALLEEGASQPSPLAQPAPLLPLHRLEHAEQQPIPSHLTPFPPSLWVGMSAHLTGEEPEVPLGHLPGPLHQLPL